MTMIILLLWKKALLLNIAASLLFGRFFVHSKYVAQAAEERMDMDELCRFYPHWWSIDGAFARCKEYMGWNPTVPLWWEDETFDTIKDRFDPMRKCVTEEFEAFEKTWPDCDLEENEQSPFCLSPSDPEAASIYRHSEEGEIVTVEDSLTPHEGFMVKAVAQCVRKVFVNDKDNRYYETRTLHTEAERRHAEKTATKKNKLERSSGKTTSTFLAGFLQIFAPGVVAQMIRIATVAWAEAEWEDKGRPDPRSIGIRTMEHLSYETKSRVIVHSDSISTYTVLVSLSDPQDYKGGDFQLESRGIMFKPEKLTAIVLPSDIHHGMQNITAGKLETFAAEFWIFYDTPVYHGRPDLVSMKKFFKEQDEARTVKAREDDEEF